MNTQTKQIARHIRINYRWKRADGGEIRPEHIGALEETAEDRIFEMLSRGYKSGELSDCIRMDDGDPEDGQPYAGWFDIEHEDQ